MRPGILRITLGILVLSLFVTGDLWAANGASPVGVHGSRVSVHAEGMSLGELLMLVEDLTGVQFRFDESVAERKVFLDFKGLPLSEGIKRMIFPLNCAAIYDDRGNLRKVIILDRWKGSGIRVPREGGNDSPRGPKPGPPDLISFTTKGSSDSSGESKGPTLRKGPIYFDGPPVDKVYSGDRPPNTQNKIPEDLPVPSVEGSGHLPVPDSEGAVMEPLPVDQASPEGRPPNTRDEMLEDLPIPGVASSEHLPIPDS